MESKKILVTGAAGFIGYHLCEALIKQGHRVIGLDNINDYYDVNLKYARLSELGIQKRLQRYLQKYQRVHSTAIACNLYGSILKIERRCQNCLRHLILTWCVTLRRKAGVRYSIENPEAYIDSNVTGFLNILECCRHHRVKRLVYASSSSVYGNSDDTTF